MIARFIVALVIVALVICGLLASRIVGIHYPEIIENQPFENGVKIIRIDGGSLVLEDGVSVDMGDYDCLSADFRSRIHISVGDLVEVKADQSGDCRIYARANGWVCGTPWAQPITIPLIKDRAYKNRIELVWIGKIRS